ncbi:hypothetical protein GRJ22_02045 [Photobacterium carnosum]|uniref:hypothetical protein n=1 Tax=Photobacterium carnosum TaxID=2023717 RepID=UPI00128DAE38|nr:hypothetical protein [Photobacterium carnosum]KAE8177494.1 hypothetical protein CIT27_07130 [Photobacterium carnosum]MCD9525330.1 hypothetical protein [Photobacterium carnosum]MCD9545440.1 hypothetical protein [Photobacterium carnosum]MCD9555231.1 hypothetical protein [Photobacterium carnosum]
MDIKVNKRQEQLLNDTIAQWQQQQLIDTQQAQQLRQSYHVISFDWKLLAVYSFWAAIACFILSVILLVADDYLIALISHLIDTPASVLTILSAIIAGLFFYFGVKRRQRYPEKTVSNEAIFFFGVLITAVASGFLSHTTLALHWRESLFIIIPTVIYLIIGIQLRSVLVWLFALLGVGLWVLTETSYLAHDHYLFWGMNIPLRFTVIGLLIVGLSSIFKPNSRFYFTKEATQFIGLIYFFTALWMLTIFGNYDSLRAWSNIKQIELWGWSVAMLLITLSAIFYGIKYNDPLVRAFGIIFLLLCLYSRYFEYFWDTLHKALFFAILALSFWIIGGRAEKIWQLGNKG